MNDEIEVGDHIRWWYLDASRSCKSNAGTVKKVSHDGQIVVDTIDGKKDHITNMSVGVNYGGKM